MEDHGREMTGGGCAGPATVLGTAAQQGLIDPSKLRSGRGIDLNKPVTVTKMAPTRATTLPSTAAERKTYPVASGLMDYFPDALAAIANVSYRGNEQHNPGQPLHWNRGKSTDEADTMLRHFLERGTIDTDGVRHSAKMAWRALALLQKEIEAAEAQKEGADEPIQYRGAVADQERELRKMAEEQKAKAYHDQQAKLAAQTLDKPVHPRSCPQKPSELCGACSNTQYDHCRDLAAARARNMAAAAGLNPAPSKRETIYDKRVSAKDTHDAGWSEGHYHITVERERY